ncbi:MAG TPA: hypothetical protein VK553_02570 [Candidatus Nitrosopolaris rasttigaisensis]|nr:hypothetical protein [Candidatus Nitrosopolaris rasttigaisensis]
MPTGTYCDHYKIGNITVWVGAHTSGGTPFDMKLLTVNRRGSLNNANRCSAGIGTANNHNDITNVDRCTSCVGILHTPIGLNSFP